MGDNSLHKRLIYDEDTKTFYLGKTQPKIIIDGKDDLIRVGCKEISGRALEELCLYYRQVKGKGFVAMEIQ